MEIEDDSLIKIVTFVFALLLLLVIIVMLLDNQPKVFYYVKIILALVTLYSLTVVVDRLRKIEF